MDFGKLVFLLFWGAGKRPAPQKDFGRKSGPPGVPDYCFGAPLEIVHTILASIGRFGVPVRCPLDFGGSIHWVFLDVFGATATNRKNKSC